MSGERKITVKLLGDGSGLEGDELSRRTSAIADVGYKRQEYLKANEMFDAR